MSTVGYCRIDRDLLWRYLRRSKGLWVNFRLDIVFSLMNGCPMVCSWKSQFSSPRPSLLRVRIEVDAEVYKSIRDDVRFYITTKGVLGDPFLEIDPGVSATACLRSDQRRAA